MASNNQNMDQIRRVASDMVAELHARKLAIPAAVLLVATIAAAIVLPKSSTPPPPEPVVNGGAQIEQIEQPAQVSLKLIGVTPLTNDIPLTNSSDPFAGKSNSDCTRVGSGEPKQFDCKIGDLMVRVMCPAKGDGDTGSGICASKSGATAETGGGSTEKTGGSDGGMTAPTGDGKSGTGDKKKSTPKVSYYVAGVTLDGKSFSNVVAGDPLPSTGNPLATYAGTNDSNNRGIFIAGDKVTVTGVPLDEELGSFELAKGDSATLTDADGVVHTLTLKSLKKVTK